MDATRPRRRKARFRYKIASAVDTVVPVDKCVLPDFGIQWLLRSPINASHSTVEQRVTLGRISPITPDTYEIISVDSYLRQVDERRQHSGRSPVIQLRVADLTDEEAFALTMSEVLRDGGYDRPSVARAIERAHRRYYKYGFAWMAERLAIESNELKGLVELARLPEEIVDSFPSVDALSSDMILALAQLLRNQKRGPAVMARAAVIATDRAERVRLGLALRPARDVFDDLQAPVSPRARIGLTEVRTNEGALVGLLRIRCPGVGTLEIFNPPGLSGDERSSAIQAALHRLDRDLDGRDGA